MGARGGGEGRIAQVGNYKRCENSISHGRCGGLFVQCVCLNSSHLRDINGLIIPGVWGYYKAGL